MEESDEGFKKEIKEIFKVLTNKNEYIEARRETLRKLMNSLIKENWWDAFTDEEMRGLLDIAKVDEDPGLRLFVFIPLLTLLKYTEKYSMVSDENIRNIIEVAKNVEDDPHVRRDALEALSILLEKGKGLNVITEEDIRDFLDIAVDNEENHSVREAALQHLSVLKSYGRVIDMINYEDIQALLKTAMNKEEGAEMRETALSFVLELADNGRAKDIIWGLANIIEEDIVVAKMKERELSEWEKDRLQKLEEGLKKGTLSPYEKLFLAFLKKKRGNFDKKNISDKY